MTIASPWLATAPSPGWEPLDGDRRADVCVIGAGIAGVTAAVLLAEAGRDVVVIEKDEVGAGVTGYTTAKLSVLHGTAYSEITSKHGEDAAAVYAQANAAGLDLIRRWACERAIDCDLRERANFTYGDEDDITQEAEALQAAGVEATVTGTTDLPYEVEAAVRVEGQADFHPRRYLLALAEGLPAVHEHTRAVAVDDGSPCRVKTDRGTITCDEVIVASHYPILDRGLFFARLSPERSYAIAIRVRGAVPEGMYISAGSPTRSIRSAPIDGEELIIVGGEGHKTGHGGSTEERYARLEEFAREHWDVVDIPYRWASQDCQPADGLPYVGKVSPVSRHLWTMTGFRKWGLTNGTAAAMIVADRLLDRDNAWADTLDSNRFAPRAAAPKVLKENLDVAMRFFGDRLAPPESLTLGRLEPGRGGIVLHKGRRIAAYRHDDGRVEACSSICTHLFCEVRFNDAERTWDCPCHGSRFGLDGRVVEGPAVRDLKRLDVE